MNKLSETLIFGLLLNFLLVLFTVKFFNFYVITVAISAALHIASDIYEKIRDKELGFSVYKIKGYKGLKIFNLVSSFMPIFNFIYASFRYFEIANTTDVRYLFTRIDKLEPFRETVKDNKIGEEKSKVFDFPSSQNDEKIEIEYDGLTKKEYNMAQKMVVVDDYVDEIIMNVNLSKEEKIELLKKMRKQLYLTNNVRMSPNKILKMSKKK